MAVKVSIILLAVVAVMVVSATAHSEATDDSTRHLAAAHATPMSALSAGLGRKLIQTCWMKVSDKEPSDDGWVLYCCDGDGSDANCLGPANNKYTCSSQYDGSHTANWCKNNSC